MINNIKKDFAIKLKEKRESIKMTQRELAVKIGVTQQCISEWESASTAPTLIPLCLLSDLFEITLDELIGRKGS